MIRKIYKFYAQKSFNHLIRGINDYKCLPENEAKAIPKNQNFKTNNKNNLSLAAQFLLKDDNDSLPFDSFQIKDSKISFEEIENIANTQISIPKICVEIFKNDDSSATTSFEVPRTGKVTFELFGQPDSSQPISEIPCPGCGSFLHCKDTGIPGYLPSYKYLHLTRAQLKSTMCQRCLLLKEKNIALGVNVDKHEYRHVIREIKKHPALILVLVDLFDLPNSFYYRIRELIHADRPIYLIGNKVDLLPYDGPGYFKSIKNTLIKLCTENGFCIEKDIKHVGLISAKTGYGIEHLITRLLKEWRLKGHVYILGCANSGKSTLFNALISSDFCHSSAREILHRATTSIWPGTTLNLLKFPILNPKPAYMVDRYNRLKELDKVNEGHRLNTQRYSKTKNPSLIDYIGLSISSPSERAITEKLGTESSFVVPSYTFYNSGNQLEQHSGVEGALKYLDAKPIPYDDSKFRYWCYDTPGLINDNQIINILNQEELAKVLPSQPIVPRTFIVKPGQVVFLSGLSRIDYMKGDVSIYFTIFASKELPIQIINSEEADSYWKDNLGSKELAVPIGNYDRMLSLPSLIGFDMRVEGIGWEESAADIVLSSLGWAAITVGLGRTVSLRAYTVGGKGCKVRSPSLLPRAINLKGKRIKGTPCYELTKVKNLIKCQQDQRETILAQ